MSETASQTREVCTARAQLDSRTREHAVICGGEWIRHRTRDSPMNLRNVPPAHDTVVACSWMARSVAGALVLAAGASHAAQVLISGPSGSGAFGTRVAVLPNGNLVVTDPFFDAPGPIADVGAVYLFRPDGSLLSTLRGSTADDRVGSGGVTVLSTGNFLVGSPSWNNVAAPGAGALTFVRADIGIEGVVSASNSLVGTTAGDAVGTSGGQGVNTGVTLLTNGNYVVTSRFWDNAGVENASAVTFGSGATGVSGPVSPANSLVGSAAFDYVGSARVTPLPNGNYLVASPAWDNGAVQDAGAVTFGAGTTGAAGVISPANSLVGGSAGDAVGFDGVTVLANGNFVVRITGWDSTSAADVGAVTFGSGSDGVAGLVAPGNSLVGSSAGDQIGKDGVTALANGNYVVRSTYWDNSGVVDAGAVTFGSGSSGVSGAVTSGNSLVGSSTGDFVGSVGVAALPNGNYVVSSPLWDNGPMPNVGAATFGLGSVGIAGPVSPSNSLVGSESDDFVGIAGVTVLGNGNFVVPSLYWNNGAVSNAGAATFGSGTSGISGVVAPSNSLVGSSAGDWVGYRVTALPNGNFVVRSPFWRNGTASAAGASTFGSGIDGITGVVSSANSLVGSTQGDQVGSGVLALANGNYLVQSPSWDDGATSDVGALTFGSGTTGISGVVSSSNSLVGSTASDLVGTATPLDDGNFVVRSSFWDNGAAVDAGAVTFGSGSAGIVGIVSSVNSLVGSSPDDRVGSIVVAVGGGAYVVGSPYWDAGGASDAGALAYGPAGIGVSGALMASSSLVGGGSGDRIGSGGVTALGNGNYVVNSPHWGSAATTGAGAVTLGLSNGSVIGPVDSTHSVLGTVAGQGETQVSSYDAVRNQLVVGQSASNRVVLHRTGIETAIAIVGDAPDPSNAGQAVTFTATLSSTPFAPTEGQVTFSAASGESCVDASPSPVSQSMIEFSCSMVFAAPGATTVVAEYTGSFLHAYSRSGPEAHTTVGDPLFASGFESP
jgi:hypothetical protein